MTRFIASRLLQAVVTLFAISLIVFFAARASGDPLQLLLPNNATPEDFAAVSRELGLDRPLPTQYALWLGNVVQGDFGISIRSRAPVSELLSARIPNSLSLAAFAMSLALVLSVPLGAIAALRRGTRTDTAIKFVALLGQSVPAFWLGLVLVLLLSVTLRWLPTSGTGGFDHYVMPGVTLAWAVAAGVIRLVRSSMLEALESDYVRMARIKGLAPWRVVFIHALRNALIPVMTFAALYLSLFIGTAVVVETVFNWPGLGRLAYEAVIWRDFPLIQAVVLTVAAAIMLINLLVDVLYAYVDPRIRY